MSYKKSEFIDLHLSLSAEDPDLKHFKHVLELAIRGKDYMKARGTYTTSDIDQAIICLAQFLSMIEDMEKKNKMSLFFAKLEKLITLEKFKSFIDDYTDEELHEAIRLIREKG